MCITCSSIRLIYRDKMTLKIDLAKGKQTSIPYQRVFSYNFKVQGLHIKIAINLKSTPIK